MAAQQLDIKANRKEQAIRNLKKEDIKKDDLIEDVDDCYFNSIKAKIAILKEANQIE